MSVSELARQIGISQPYLSQIERGDRACPHDVLQKACDIFGITLVDFFSDDTEQPSPELLRILRALQKLRPDQQAIIERLIDELSKSNE
ncbi:MAG: helix-turn-helix domain-containing protein [Alicyclobacillus macrosporangiidus]|nr:helix-turn-helix domain-containing protein [Alicyclobacillus macrosporangiidus]